MSLIADFRVDGNPQPKGSWTPVVRDGKAIMLPARAKKRKDGSRSTEARDRYVAWNRSVTAAANVWALTHRRKLIDAEPLRVELGFFLERPKSSKELFPVRKPDVDKLCRLVLDALTKGRLITDDARVVDLVISKRFATGKPGVRVIVSSLAELAA